MNRYFCLISVVVSSLFLVLGCSSKKKAEDAPVTVAASAPISTEPPVVHVLKGTVELSSQLQAEKRADIMLAQLDEGSLQALVQAKAKKPAATFRVLVFDSKITDKQKQKLMDAHVELILSQAPVLSSAVITDDKKIVWLGVPAVELKSPVLAQVAHQYFDEVTKDPSAEYAMIARDQQVEIAMENAFEDLALDMISKAQKSVVISLASVKLSDDENEDGSELAEEILARKGEVSIDVRLGCPQGAEQKNDMDELVDILRKGGVKKLQMCADKNIKSFYLRDSETLLIGASQWQDEDNGIRRILGLRWKDAHAAAELMGVPMTLPAKEKPVKASKAKKKK